MENVAIDQAIERKARELDTLKQLKEQLAQKAAELDTLNHQVLMVMNGQEGEATPTQPHNNKTLEEHLIEVAKQAKGPILVNDAAKAVLRTGFRTNARNFNAVVYQQLKESDHFHKARGRRGGRKTSWVLAK